MPAQPPRTSTPTPAPRGVKREFEDSALTQPNAQGPGPGPAAVNSSGSVSPTSGQVQRPGAAKAGVPGARPRPLKKQRVVSYHFTISKNMQSPGKKSRCLARVYMCSLPIAMLRFVLFPPPSVAILVLRASHC